MGFYKRSAGLHVKLRAEDYFSGEWVLSATAEADSPMQVATLFRESASLLGATMDSGGGGPQDPGLASLGPGPGPHSYDAYNHPVQFSNKYKL